MIAGEAILDRPNAHLKTIKTERQTDTKGSVGWIQEAHRVKGWIVFGRVRQKARKKFWMDKICWSSKCYCKY